MPRKMLISERLTELRSKRLESESGLEVYETTRDQVRRAFEGNGIVLLTSDQGEGVMLVRAKIDSRKSS